MHEMGMFHPELSLCSVRFQILCITQSTSPVFPSPIIHAHFTLVFVVTLQAYKMRDMRSLRSSEIKKKYYERAFPNLVIQ